MNNFIFHNPTKIVFGKQMLEKVGSLIEEQGAQKVMILYDGDYLVETGTISFVQQSLQKKGIDFIEVSGVMPNPLLSYVEGLIEQGQKEKVDFILAIGGGSTIDAAKATAVGIVNESSLEDLFMGKAQVCSTLPVGVISTLAGSGSETSCSMIITLDDGLLKRPVDDEKIRPCFAILDPTLTFTVPSYHMISGGCDIIFHTLERYFTPTENVDLIDRMSEGLILSTMKNLLRSMANPKDYNARAHLMWAGNLSHNGLLETGRDTDWATHRLEHELSGLYDVTHGAGLCALWGSWARYVYQEDVKRFVQFAVNVMGVQDDPYHPEETALLGIERFEAFLSSVGMPINLQDLGLTISQEDKEKMAHNCLLTSDHVGSFKPLFFEDIMNIYTLSEGGQK